jgi:hypothetical protein
MKILSLMKKGGISYSSARNGVGKSIGGETQPHAPGVFEMGYYSLGGKLLLTMHAVRIVSYAVTIYA